MKIGLHRRSHDRARAMALALSLLGAACSSQDEGTAGTADAAPPDSGTPHDAGSPDAGSADATFVDDAFVDAADAASIDAAVGPSDGDAANAGDAAQAPDVSATDASDDAATACAASPPSVDPSIAVPDDAGLIVLLHASGSGTQNYGCSEAADGGSSWVLVTPEADLLDCHGAVIGQHFASEGGASAPEWLLDDGSYAVGSRVASFVPDGGASSIPWLLLRVTSMSDAGVISGAAFVQRTSTNGGLAPAGACAADAGLAAIPYTADYFFYGP